MVLLMWSVFHFHVIFFALMIMMIITMLITMLIMALKQVNVTEGETVMSCMEKLLQRRGFTPSNFEVFIVMMAVPVLTTIVRIELQQETSSEEKLPPVKLPVFDEKRL